MMTSRAQGITVVVVSINIDMADSDEHGTVVLVDFIAMFLAVTIVRRRIKVVSHFMLFPKMANFENYG